MMELKGIDPPIGFQMVNTGERSRHLQVPKLIIASSFLKGYLLLDVL